MSATKEDSTDDALQIETIEKGQSVEIIGVHGGYVCVLLGVDDWNVSRLDEARMMVLYQFENRQAAHTAVGALRNVFKLSEEEVDANFHVKHTVVMGEGIRPHDLLFPIKIIINAPHGFVHSPMRTFDRGVEIARAGDWHQVPELRASPKRTSANGGGKTAAQVDADDIAPSLERQESPFEKRLPAAPRIVYDGKHGYTVPGFKYGVESHERRIAPTSYGKDENGNRVLLGITIVKGHSRNVDKPERPDHLTKPKRPKKHVLIPTPGSQSR